MSSESFVSCIVDLDAEPFAVYDFWSVEEHQKTGLFKWDAAKVVLYLSEQQQGGKSIEGNKLRESLRGKGVFNVNLLDHLLRYPECIPDEWRSRHVFFWGTVYRDARGGLYVRNLYWAGNKWRSGYDWLGSSWLDRSPAAILADRI